ncbi:MAG: peptidyl-prolyl cis-trans isomerase [Candidatus Sumerlaeaceae bacterium]|nr:peptidyl-prolyl cis-trans isomerase [Candidatus Sumerlaeaceae bacterium]
MPTEVRASHILFDNEKHAQDAKAKIAAGEKFAKMAKRFSTCPSGANGGDLGFFAKGVMDETFEAAAFSAKKDTVIGPIKTAFGYHLIMVTDTKD